MIALFRDDEMLITPEGADEVFTRPDGGLLARARFLPPPSSTGVREDLRELWRDFKQPAGTFSRLDHSLEDPTGVRVLTSVRWPGTRTKFTLEINTPNGAPSGAAIGRRKRFRRSSTTVVYDAFGSTVAKVEIGRTFRVIDAQGRECGAVEAGPVVGHAAAGSAQLPSVVTVRGRRVHFASWFPDPARTLVAVTLVAIPIIPAD